MVRDPGQVFLSVRHPQRDWEWGEVFSSPRRRGGCPTLGEKKVTLFHYIKVPVKTVDMGMCVSGGSHYRPLGSIHFIQVASRGWDCSICVDGKDSPQSLHVCSPSGCLRTTMPSCEGGHSLGAPYRGHQVWHSGGSSWKAIVTPSPVPFKRHHLICTLSPE